jgi:DNA-binding transcriptional MerR regulator
VQSIYDPAPTEPSPIVLPDRAAKYSVKAIAQLVGLSAVTLRAWERRYGLPSPQRGVQNYRLYSDYDVRTLRWLKNQVEGGMAISRAAQYLSELRQAGMDPAEADRTVVTAKQVQSPANLAQRLVQAFMAFDEGQAGDVLRFAFSIYPLDQVLIDVLGPALVELGEGWHRGEVSIAVEHFGVHFSLRQINAMLASSAPAHRPGLILAACAPREQHEFGLLILIAMLRWRGWDVRYLGQNLPLDQVQIAIGQLRPRLLLFSASTPETAHALSTLPELLDSCPPPRPRIVIGGRSVAAVAEQFRNFAVCLDGPAHDMVGMVESLMSAAGDEVGFTENGREAP